MPSRDSPVPTGRIAEGDFVHVRPTMTDGGPKTRTVEKMDDEIEWLRGGHPLASSARIPRTYTIHQDLRSLPEFKRRGRNHQIQAQFDSHGSRYKSTNDSNTNDTFSMTGFQTSFS